MRREILWYTLDGTDDDASFVAASMTTFVDRLGAMLPELKVRGRELSGELLTAVRASLETGHLEGAVSVIHGYRRVSDRGLLTHVSIYCPNPAHPAACVARRRLPHAAWGISLAGTLSLTYVRGNRHALWHETLHLLGAQDHYDPRRFRSTCDLRTCLMQYAPDATTVGDLPFICKATAAILRKGCS